MKVVKSFTFDAGHRLSNYEGKCRNLHGHTYRVKITVEGNLDGLGMVLDFGILKQVYNEKIDAFFDHKLLLLSNDPINQKIYEIFPESIVMLSYNPTAENMAKDIFNRMNWGLRDFCDSHIEKIYIPIPVVTKVVIYETPTSYAEYEGEEI